MTMQNENSWQNDSRKHHPVLDNHNLWAVHGIEACLSSALFVDSQEGPRGALEGTKSPSRFYGE